MASVHKRTWRTKAGEKVAWVADWFDQDGKRHIKTFTRQRDAKDWLDQTKSAIKQGTHVPDSAAPTLSAACEAWIKRGEAEQKERSTLAQRRQHVDLHILPMLGRNTKLSRLTVAQIEAFRDDLLRTRSRALAKKVMTSFKSILKQARMAHLVADVDKIATNGRHRKRFEVGRDIPTKQEVNAMLEAASGYMRPLLAVAVFCGLRMSEIRALRWQDVGFDARKVHVRQRADKWCQIGPLKSETSYRSIPMSPMVVNALKEWRLACPRRGVTRDQDGNVVDPGELHLVFPNGAGNVESLPNIWNRHLAPLEVAAVVVSGPKLDKAGKPIVDKDGNPVMLAKYGAHSLRHFFASWLIDQSFGPKRVQSYMGHSGIQVTFDIYGHLFPQEDDHERFAAGELALVGS